MPSLHRFLPSCRRFIPFSSATFHSLAARSSPPLPSISFTSSKANHSFHSNFLLPAALFLAAGSVAAWRDCPLPSQESRSSSETLVQGSSEALPSSFIEELKAVCGDDGVVLDSDERIVHSRSLNNFFPVVNIPDVVVYPRCQEEVAAIVKSCNKYKIPIVPCGGATSIEGQILAPHGGVSIDMNLMKKIKALHIEDMDVVVEPGLGWMELNEYLKPHGLFFPLDPGPGASIGGMCATRCSGSLAVRYGTMRDNVISLKAVLANGDVIKTANRPRKTAAGYDLTRLMIGSEGTLGVITEVTLRLQKIPEASIAAICNFPTIKNAADVAIATMHSGIQVSRMELLDEVIIKGINNANGKNLAEKPTLMFEFIGTETYVNEQALRIQKIVEDHKGHDFIYFQKPEEKEELWRVQISSFPSFEEV